MKPLFFALFLASSFSLLAEDAGLLIQLGQGPFTKVTLIKDNVEIPLAASNTKEVRLDWTDPKPEAGKPSYYYVRGEQANSELVWASPMWIKSE